MVIEADLTDIQYKPTELKLANADLFSAENEDALRQLEEDGQVSFDREFKAQIKNAQTYPDNLGVPSGLYRSVAPEIIKEITARTVAEEIASPVTYGKWTDEEILFKVVKYMGQVDPYDFGVANVRKTGASYNYFARGTYYYATLKEFNADTAEKDAAGLRPSYRQDIDKATEITLRQYRNKVQFNGIETYNPNQPIYGLLNDPSLLPVITIPSGASGNTTWASKTPEEIHNDLVYLINQLFIQTNSTLNDQKGRTIKISVASDVQGLLLRTNNFGLVAQKSINETIKSQFPLSEFIFVPEYNKAGAGGTNLLRMELEGNTKLMTLQKARYYPIEQKYAIQRQLIAGGISSSVTFYPLFCLRAQGI
jgi:hypothetical protein